MSSSDSLEPFRTRSHKFFPMLTAMIGKPWCQPRHQIDRFQIESVVFLSLVKDLELIRRQPRGCEPQRTDGWGRRSSSVESSCSSSLLCAGDAQHSHRSHPRPRKANPCDPLAIRRSKISNATSLFRENNEPRVRPLNRVCSTLDTRIEEIRLSVV